MKRIATTDALLSSRRACLLLSLLLCSCAVAAQEFSFKDTKGNVLRLADYRGKWVLVNFRSSQCVPCEEETPELVELHNAHKNSDLVVIGIELDTTPIVKTQAFIDAFVARHHVTYPLVISSYTMAETQVGAVETLPTSYMYDPTGTPVIFQGGAVTRADVERYLLLKNESIKKETK